MYSKTDQLKTKKDAKKRNRKRCKLKSCNKLFTPVRDFQKCCSYECNIAFVSDKDNLKKLVDDGKKKNEKENRAKKKQFKINDNKELLRLAEITVNKYIRLRDKNEPCISCGVLVAKWDAGHYESVGSDKQLRYNTLNIHKQCYYCNCHLSANKTPYRINLIEKIGVEKVERLENDHSSKTYTVEYLQKLIKVFKKKIKLYEKRR